MNDNKTAAAEVRLAPVVDELCAAASALAPRRNGSGRIVLPSRDVILACVEDLRAVFFPGYFGATDLADEHLHYYIGATLDRVLHLLEEQMRRGIAFAERHDYETCEHCSERSAEVTRAFLARLPDVRRLVSTDVDAAYEGDPALKIKDEAIFSYPGRAGGDEPAHRARAVRAGGAAHPEDDHRARPRRDRASTSIPGARIGEKFFIDHGTGVVIGETAIIGKNVRIYQGVTLGAKSFPLDENGMPIKGVDRHPIVEDDVVIYSGATILGRVTIGKGSSIGGNVWLTHGVPPGSRVTQADVREAGFQYGGGI